jgi:hypothetical protein
MISLNFATQIYRLLPPLYRQKFWRDWLCALLHPAQQLHEQSLLLAAADIGEIRYTSQVLALEHLLRTRVHAGIFLEHKAFAGRLLLARGAAQARSPMIGRAEILDWSVTIGRSQLYSSADAHLLIKYPLNAAIDTALLNVLASRYIHCGFVYRLEPYILVAPIN